METSDRLSLLKHDLQLLTNSNDTYLTSLLTKSEEAVNREGIAKPAETETGVEYDYCVIDYAAYLFRKRASQTDTAMPKFLRLELNNLKFHQKMATTSESTGS